jgi:hypothetical protein
LGASGNANQVFCAYGTGNPSDPTSWTGEINVPNAPSSFNFTDSFIGGYVYLGLHSNGTINAELSTSLGKLLIYAAGPSDASSPFTTSSFCVASPGPPCTAALDGSGGTPTVNGDIFVPNGSVNLNNKGGANWTTFVQAWKVGLFTSGGLTGDGPGGGPGGSPLPGADLLIQ